VSEDTFFTTKETGTAIRQRAGLKKSDREKGSWWQGSTNAEENRILTMGSMRREAHKKKEATIGSTSGAPAPSKTVNFLRQGPQRVKGAAVRKRGSQEEVGRGCTSRPILDKALGHGEWHPGEIGPVSDSMVVEEGCRR